jgi:hypothetical protein
MCRYAMVRFACISFGSLGGSRVCSIILFISDALWHVTEEPQTILRKWEPTRQLQGCCRVAGTHRGTPAFKICRWI